MSEYKDAQDTIMDAIRPRTFPLAARFLREGEELPPKTRRPSQVLKKRVTVCQGVTMARVYGWNVGLMKEDIICVPALLAWGMSGAENVKEEITSLFVEVGFARNEEVAKSQAMSLNCPDEGEVAGILLSPLAKAQAEPHTVVVYCNPAQAMRLVQGLSYSTKGEVEGSFGGKVECVDTLYAAHRLEEPRVSIPGMGDRIFSMTQDDELAVSVPARLLDKLLDGLAEAAKKIGARYPVTFYQNFEPQFPPVYLEMGKRLGLLEED